MSSSVFFKFKSQKEPSRVTFDGTGITVFDLKREIITLHRLGDGSDFNLAIYNEDTNEEYDDDTTVIPRSTSIIARRLPPSKQGRGTAHRYVTSKMPTPSAPNAQRTEKGFSKAVVRKDEPISGATSSIPGFASGAGDSEEDKIAAMFQANSEVWNKTQEQMANATPVHRGPLGASFRKNVPVPSHPPPNGYICYRCGEKGHWIQACPTNSDPNFDGRPRVKRTTGIPRSFLKTVEKPVIPTMDTDDATTQRDTPSSIMVNAEGEYVVAEPDKASWESYKQKAAKSSTKPTPPEGNKELQELGLECSYDHKLFKDAVKTPCCGKVYCEECIQIQLFDTDFVCPNCEAKDILLDRLVVDIETRKKVEEYEKRDSGESKELKPKSPSIASSAGIGTVATLATGFADSSSSPTIVTPSQKQLEQSSTQQISSSRTASSKLQQLPLHQPQVPNQQKIPSVDSTMKSPPVSKKRPYEEIENVSQSDIAIGPQTLRNNHIVTQNDQFRQNKTQLFPHKHTQVLSNQQIQAQQITQPHGMFNGPGYSHQNQLQHAYNNHSQYPQDHFYGNGNNPNQYLPHTGGMMNGLGGGMVSGMSGMGMNMAMGNMGMANMSMGSMGMGNMGMGNMGMGNMGMGNMGMGNMGISMGNMSLNANSNLRNGMGSNMHGMMNNMNPGMGRNMPNGPQNMGMVGIGPRAPNQVINGAMMNNLPMNGMSGMGMLNGTPNMIGGMMNTPNGMNAQMTYQYQGPQLNGGYYYSAQQKTVFAEPFPNEEESAYIRKPVNPHRHARPKRIRPSDSKALSGAD